MKSNFSQHRKLKLFAIRAGVVSLLALSGTFLLRHRFAMHHHQSQVAHIGSQVMPFDLEATTHRFEPLPSGGLQTVVADIPTDEQQIKLIQSHLEEESTKFQRGDFSALREFA